MLRRLLTVLFFLLSPLQAAAQLRPGDGLPVVTLEGLAQTEARSLQEFYGRAVLLEFFAFWCAPCAASVPHLNELQEEYGPRGLSILGVTTENVKKTLPFIEKHGVRYAYGYDRAGELHRLFQIQTLPSAALLGADGTVLWTGDPRRLGPKEIEAALEGALAEPVWTWPEEARALAMPLAAGQYHAALELAKTLTPKAAFDPEAFVRGRVAAALERFEKLFEREEYGLALRFGARLASGLAGLPEGERLGARLGELGLDEAVQRQVLAAERLSALEKRAETTRKRRELKELRDEVAAFVGEQAGQKCERRAKALLAALERALEKLPPKPASGEG